MDPKDWAIGNWQDITPASMKDYTEEFLNHISQMSNGGCYDTWARAEIARRQSVRLAELVTALNQATEKVQSEVTDLTASSTKLEALTKTLKNLTWVLIVLTVLAAMTPIGIEVWKGKKEPQQEGVSKQNTLDLQAKCAQSAREEFNSQKWTGVASFTDHYNAALNKCFVRVQDFETRKDGAPGGPGMFSHVFISDALEKKQYANIDKKMTELTPLLCEVTLPSGEEKKCTSTKEFETLTKLYMEQ